LNFVDLESVVVAAIEDNSENNNNNSTSSGVWSHVQEHSCESKVGEKANQIGAAMESLSSVSVESQGQGHVPGVGEEFYPIPSRDDDNEQEARDRELAVQLQERLNASLVRDEEEEEEDEYTRSTSTGQALHFVARMIDAHNRMVAEILGSPKERVRRLASQFHLVNADDLVFLAERVFRLKQAFAVLGKDTTVDIGYHYTSSASMGRIRTDGLMTNAERQARTTNGSIFGDGIYTGNNMFSYHNFGGGDQGLLVARLKGAIHYANENDGNVHSINGANRRDPVGGATVDTVLGRAGGTDEVCVLQSSRQCVALVQYSAKIVDMNVDRAAGNEFVYRWHCSVQKVVDECFNNGRTTRVTQYLPSQVTVRTLLTPAVALQRTISGLSSSLQEMILYTAPESVNQDISVWNEEAVMQELAVTSPYSSTCAACKQGTQDVGAGVVCRLPRCFHEFHWSCLLGTLRQHSQTCPYCSKRIGNVQGRLPPNALWVDPRNTPGSLRVYYDTGTRIDPNQTKNRYSWTSYVSYLPSKGENEKSNSPPKFAFACGTTFDMIFSQKGANGETVMLRWKDIFDNVVILKRLRKAAEKHCKRCSSCSKLAPKAPGKIPIGTMPTGTMRVDQVGDIACEGFKCGTFVISYKFESGAQRSYHIEPGKSYGATYRVAYLPINTDGTQLLKRLKFAFSRGLTFRIGTSLTTGLKDSIVWASIPHKTSLTKGQFGFPDPLYFRAANDELDILGVPEANTL
jgi:Deltex C-terminal domain